MPIISYQERLQEKIKRDDHNLLETAVKTFFIRSCRIRISHIWLKQTGFKGMKPKWWFSEFYNYISLPYWEILVGMFNNCLKFECRKIASISLFWTKLHQVLHKELHSYSSFDRSVKFQIVRGVWHIFFSVTPYVIKHILKNIFFLLLLTISKYIVNCWKFPFQNS